MAKAGVTEVEEVAAERDGGHKDKSSSVMGYLTELPILVLLAFGIAIIIKTFLVQAFFIPSASMVPTLQVGDRVLVEKVSYTLGDPQRRQVVVFAKESVFGGKLPDLPWYEDVRNFGRELLGLPSPSEEDYIKRIVAVGGDTIRYQGRPRRLWINGEKVSEPYLQHRDEASPEVTSRLCGRLHMAAAEGGCRVPKEKIFVMGDNRSNSEDSRLIGPIKEEKIVGHAFVVIWPPVDFSGL
ncbi:MAG: signal peptidase I [Actinomycetota bacterium]|nr:signal peptidase I [Actinomycetota bacterium]